VEPVVQEPSPKTDGGSHASTLPGTSMTAAGRCAQAKPNQGAGSHITHNWMPPQGAAGSDQPHTSAGTGTNKGTTDDAPAAQQPGDSAGAGTNAGAYGSSLNFWMSLQEGSPVFDIDSSIHDFAAYRRSGSCLRHHRDRHESCLAFHQLWGCRILMPGTFRVCIRASADLYSMCVVCCSHGVNQMERLCAMSGAWLGFAC
jgi:hypothetical protein